MIRYSDAKKLDVVRAYGRSGGVIREACKRCQIDRSTYYDWLRKDPIFAARIRVTKQTLHRRALEAIQ